MPSVKYDAQWSMGGPPASASQNSDRATDFLPTLGAVFRVQDKLTLGVAALGTAGMGVNYAAGASGLYGQTTYTSYANMRFAPAAAYQVNDALSIGLAVNLMYAQMKYQAGGGPAHDTSGAFGYGATIGVTYAVSKAVTLGAAYETQSSFQDFEFDVAGQTQALKFDQPMIASVGAGVRPVEGLLLAADVQWINWSATNGKDLPKWSKNPIGEPQWNMNWSDQWVAKVGAEYAVGAVKGLKVRAGYDYGKKPLDASRAFENIAFPAIAEHHFTLGTGYDTGKLAVNVAGVYSPESKLTGANPAQQGILGYEVKMSQLQVELGASYNF
jgi:long-chain fatty acid transport protein